VDALNDGAALDKPLAVSAENNIWEGFLMALLVAARRGWKG
jgi:hypothetical protein